MRLHVLVVAGAVLGAAACSSSSSSSTAASARAAAGSLDLGDHHRAISTSSAEAQRLFDQSLVLTYAFNHDAAIASYAAAAQADPAAAMPHWGIALANGPHINNPAMPVDRSKAAWAALQEAQARRAGASEVERALIDALAQRYAADCPTERRALDEAYARAMREVWKRWPQDPDVGALFAESLMDLQPWDLWTKDGQPKGNTLEIVATIERVLELQPDNPGACHFYIHAMEASNEPGKALAAANRLRDLAPDAGHLVHMPAHIDLRVGHYADASEANIRAIAADARRAATVPKAGFYRMYMAHNPHFLAFASMMEGKKAQSLDAARQLIAGMPAEFVRDMAKIADGFLAIEMEVFQRFGMWDEILAVPAFPDTLTVCNAIRRYTRGTALAVRGRLDEAKAEARELEMLAAGVDDRPIGQNPAKKVLQIPVRALAGEIAYRDGRQDEAFALMREAAAIEDTLAYDEPPDWMMPVRHMLAATLLDARRFDEAEKVLLEDLKRFPENGWSLSGLVRARKGRGDAKAASDAEARFRKAWAAADEKIDSPCACLPGG